MKTKVATDPPLTPPRRELTRARTNAGSVFVVERNHPIEDEDEQDDEDETEVHGESLHGSRSSRLVHGEPSFAWSHALGP